MRRTPSFKREKVAEGAEYFLLKPRRPSKLIGDFLENQRILQVLHKHMQLPELTGIIDDKNALESFYFFDGIRFIKDKITSMFDTSEYGFDNMLLALNSASIEEVEKTYAIEKYDTASFTEFLDNFQQGNYPILELLFDILAVMASETSIGITWRDNELAEYSSDSVNGIPGYKMESLPPKLIYTLFESRDAYARLAEEEYKISSTLTRLGTLKRRSTDSRLINLFIRKTFIVDNVVRKMVSSTIFYNYMQRLSACMNLPDDKYTELIESKLIDEWIILFEAFYPKYEKLKTWYEANREVKATF